MTHLMASRRVAAAALCAAMLPLFPAPLSAQQRGSGAAPDEPPAPRVARAAPAPAALTIDGRLDDAAWSDAPVLTDFVQREPFEGRPASERTEVRILYDADALYIGAWLFESEPSEIVLGETRRDADLADSDALVLILDTYHDRQNGFVFGTTPAGIEYDGQVTLEGQGGFSAARRQQAGSGGGFNKNWDGSWEVATSRDADGWYAEFRIPFATLRYGQGGPQTWGLNFSRSIRRRHEESFWAPVSRQYNLYRVSEAGTLTGLEAPARRVAQVMPYVLGSSRRNYAIEPEFGNDAELGADAKIGVSSSLILDLTYNTDFAQVEVDDEQLNLTRFRLFFPEKRPFFLENAGVFSVGTPQEVELFFSRRIGIEEDARVPIRGGGRLSGRLGGLQVGLLDIQTGGATPIDIETGEVLAAVPANNFSVIRVLRELPNRSRIGLIAANRVSTQDTDDRNHTYAIDGRLGLGDALSFDGYAARTTTPADSVAGHALSLSANYTTRDWRLGGAFIEVGHGFDPQVGFLTRSDYRFFSARILRALRFPSVPWFREMRPHMTYREYRDLDGFTETRLLHFDSHFEFANGAFFQLPATNFTREGLKEPFEIADGVVVPPGTYDNIEWGFAYNTNKSAPVSVDGRIDIGGFYSGHRAGTTSNLNIRAGESFTAGLRVGYYDVRLREGDFTSSLLGLRLAYAFTPRVYLQSLIQYNDQTRQFSSNIRFGWLSTAGTGLFIVYNDIEDLDLFDRQVARSPLERGLVVKFSRQFDLAL